jgi:hypothetical protein
VNGAARLDLVRTRSKTSLGPDRLGGMGRGREPLSIATKVITASVTSTCSSPSRERRQASTVNLIEGRPTDIASSALRRAEDAACKVSLQPLGSG